MVSLGLGCKSFKGDTILAKISFPDELQTVGENVFADNTVLARIEYCGKLTSFPIAAICPPERLAAIAAKEKAASDKAAADLLAKQKPATTAPVTKITITCIKGKVNKKVTALKPTCPKGYKKR